MTWTTLWLAIGAAGTLAWCGLHLLGALSLARVPRLSAADARMRDEAGAAHPSLSVIVPARDEVHDLEATLRSLVAAEGLGSIEVIVVDDRSIDGTGELADALAAEHENVRAIHVHSVPAGWLGKVHALREGTEAARGDHLLFTDAGVVFAADAPARALATMRELGLDHLTLLPRLRSHGFLHAAMMQAFFVGYVRRTAGSRRPELLDVPFGYGAFNLVRREAFDATEGFAWFKMDVLDDLALGALMKRSGARSGFAVAVDALEVAWYPGLAATLRGFEKNAFGGLARYSPWRLAALTSSLLLLTAAPILLLLAAAGHPLAWALTLAAAAALAVEASLAHRLFGLPLVPGLAAPLTHALMAYALLRGGLRCLRRGGVEWRGSTYGLDELRRGRRVSFP